jgi:hypothetical protein
LRIVYIGPNWGTSRHRAEALRRLGHEVGVVDPWDYLGHSRWVARWLVHAGALGVPLVIDEPIFRRVRESRPDFVWVDQGAFLGPKLLRRLRTLSVPIINYTIDDPFGGRDGLRFRLYLKALRHYDLVAAVRDVNVSEARDAGARNVIMVFMSADEIARCPLALAPDERQHYASEVAFVGTWMPERGPFIAELVRLGVPISIWGDRWHKAREWPILKSYWRGTGLYDERYAKIILSAKVVLGLLSKDNRDLHTTRSMEIPAMGAVLCAERTSEHRALYEDGVEAVFWSTPEECAAACRRLLSDETYRQSVARRGRERLARNGHYNEQVLA